MVNTIIYLKFEWKTMISNVLRLGVKMVDSLNWFIEMEICIIICNEINNMKYKQNGI